VTDSVWVSVDFSPAFKAFAPADGNMVNSALKQSSCHAVKTADLLDLQLYIETILLGI